MPLPGGIEGVYGGDWCDRVHLTKHHYDTQVDDMLCWPTVVPLLTTRYLYWGWGWGGGLRGADRGCMGCWGHWGLHIKNEDCLLQKIAHKLRWMRPKLVPLLATICLYMGALRGHMGVMGVAGYIWQNIILTHRLISWYADHSWPLDACTEVGVGCQESWWGCRGYWGFTYEKWRLSNAKYSWKLQTDYCRQ